MSSIRLIFIPLERDHVLIIVVKVSIQCHLTTLANQSVRSSDMNFRSFMYIDNELRAEGRTTVAIDDL